MSYSNEAKFITNLKRPLTQMGSSSKILCYDYNWTDNEYPNDIPANIYNTSQWNGKLDNVDGSSMHHYAGTPDTMTTVHNAYPAKDII